MLWYPGVTTTIVGFGPTTEKHDDLFRGTEEIASFMVTNVCWVVCCDLLLLLLFEGMQFVVSDDCSSLKFLKFFVLCQEAQTKREHKTSLGDSTARCKDDFAILIGDERKKSSLRSFSAKISFPAHVWLVLGQIFLFYFFL